jgi:hypothetical protein
LYNILSRACVSSGRSIYRIECIPREKCPEEFEVTDDEAAAEPGTGGSPSGSPTATDAASTLVEFIIVAVMPSSAKSGSFNKKEGTVVDCTLALPSLESSISSSGGPWSVERTSEAMFYIHW